MIIISPSGTKHDALSANASNSHGMIPRHSVLHTGKLNEGMCCFVRVSVINVN